MGAREASEGTSCLRRTRVAGIKDYVERFGEKEIVPKCNAKKKGYQCGPTKQ